MVSIERHKQEPVDVNNIWPTIKRLMRYLSASRVKITLVIFFVLSSSALSLLAPFLLGYAIDQFLEDLPFDQFTWLLIGLGVVYFFHSLTMWLQHFVMIQLAQNAVYQMRQDLFEKLHHLPIPFFDRNTHGDLMSRLTNDLENVSQTLNTSVIQLLSSVLTLTGTFIFMIYLSPLLTLVTLSVVPILYFGMNWITKRTRLYFKQQQQELGELNGYVEEMITNHTVVSIFTKEEEAIDEFTTINQRLKKASYLAQSYSGFIPKLLNVLNNLGFALLALIGGLLAINQIVTIGLIVTFTQYSRQFTRPLNELANQFNTVLSAVAGAKRVFAVLNEENEEDITDDDRTWDRIDGHLTFDQVSFSYTHDQLTLTNINLEASPGEMIAFVGPTGAGKTTMINLITRFYDPDEGEIRIDGTPIQSVSRRTLRQHIGFVLQDPYLFQATIRENIRYGKLDATDEAVEQAAKEANADPFIRTLPRGYDTVLDQDGGGISQGQKQLISIARAILSDPDLFILDEATSSIDTVTESYIQDALNNLMKNRTSVVIAHRLNTIQQADQIFVFNHGEIVESGNHETLIHQDGFYKSIYQSHFKPSTA
ncbi:ATP-binding cassette, subfamily B [Pelagirhabdus alkalitolerans]|uniref:ATP-binding cassette, subfamily B n=1 Tax=Pelagirhabdus alkalitolerans TaxID=1612202 RepID=A0A1G6GIA0_9BACI|nr:ABC transporter ATP-binding protein [Pelagirhabdus alkalitolerans]SDB80896.1 ATP-binding cassette, subfamily B [Pelagirhabdus alkalitolerans]